MELQEVSELAAESGFQVFEGALSSGGKGNTLYPAAKSFLLKFSQSLNAEVRDRGVHVTAVLPGGERIVGRLVNDRSIQDVPIPKCRDGSHSAEAWLEQ